jgi:hypothetical protein
MLTLTKQAAKAVRQKRRPVTFRGPKVVSIDFRAQQTEGRPSQQKSDNPPITQERLAKGMDLFREELRVGQALREFRMQLEADLAAGSDVDPGDLQFDRDLKVIRRKTPQATAGQ